MFQIITADQRLESHTGTKLQIWGSFGVGKTSLLWTLDPATTICMDLESGMKAVQGWQGRSVSVRTWPDCQDLAVWACGPNPALRSDQTFSTAHHEHVIGQYGPFPADIKTVFVDSITNASRYCLQWCKGQPAAMSEKTGKPDNRGAYGLLASEMVAWCEVFQHATGLNVILAGGLEEKTDDFNRVSMSPMIEGAKSASAIPYIFDQVATLAELRPEPKAAPLRRLVCHKLNSWGFPAKDRSGNLDMVESPHLGRLLEKINQPRQGFKMEE